MSVRMVCDNCGRVIYSAAAQILLSSGYRCDQCGAVPRIEEQPPEGAAANADGDEPHD